MGKLFLHIKVLNGADPVVEGLYQTFSRSESIGENFCPPGLSALPTREEPVFKFVIALQDGVRETSKIERLEPT